MGWIRHVVLFVVCSFGVTQAANAALAVGHITSVQNYPSGNMAFRITLDNPPTSAQCTSATLLYAEPSYSNYQALVATSLTAFSLGKNVQVEYTPGAYCSITDIVVQQ
jgi:hypothetical protein